MHRRTSITSHLVRHTFFPARGGQWVTRVGVVLCGLGARPSVCVVCGLKTVPLAVVRAITFLLLRHVH